MWIAPSIGYRTVEFVKVKGKEEGNDTGKRRKRKGKGKEKGKGGRE